jgi:hypothetical protein
MVTPSTELSCHVVRRCLQDKLPGATGYALRQHHHAAAGHIGNSFTLLSFRRVLGSDLNLFITRLTGLSEDRLGLFINEARKQLLGVTKY